MPRLRQKTKHLLFAGLAGVLITTLIFTVIVIYYGKHQREMRLSQKQSYEAQITQLREAAIKKIVQGWVPAKDIPAGHRIGADDLMEVELPADSVPEDVLKSREDIAGKIAKISLRPSTLLTETLLYKEEPTPNDLRWREMSFVQLPSMLKKNHVVDIRIQFPTGQDYILLSKKKVEDLVSGTVTMTLNESEILSLSSAIVDAYLHKASIYALTYVEPYLQSKAIPTYPASDAVLQLIRKDPNIVKQAEIALNDAARKRLESDLLTMNPQQVSDFTSSHTAEVPVQPPLVKTPADQDSFEMSGVDEGRK